MQLFIFILTTLLWCYLGNRLVTAKVETINDALAYLQLYGYANSAPIDLTDLQTAVRLFQQRTGLNTSGVLNNETLRQMNLPRCGLPDIIGPGHSAARSRRYVFQGSVWPIKNLTYFFINYTSDLSSENVSQIIRRAFKYWSDVSSLTFNETSESGDADIHLLFVSGAHGDRYPFDGPGDTLAHAFFPEFGGDTHFDEDETWTDKQYAGTNLLQVATHELGHALGLSHSTDSQSVMQAFYKGYDPSFHLGDDDIAAITTLYDSVTTKSPTSTPTDLCCSAHIAADQIQLLYTFILLRMFFLVFNC